MYFESDAVDKMPSTSTIRVLVAGDSVQWRSYVRHMVMAQKCFDVVGESSDGLDAVQKAFNLRPEVVLVDTSLPRFRGATVARAIRRLCPSTITILLAQNNHMEMTASLDGESGYAPKANAERDLVETISALLQARVLGSGNTQAA